jgi:hypothetical protein
MCLYMCIYVYVCMYIQEVKRIDGVESGTTGDYSEYLYVPCMYIVHISIYVCLYINMYIWYIYIFMHIYMCVYINMYIYIQEVKRTGGVDSCTYLNIYIFI